MHAPLEEAVSGAGKDGGEFPKDGDHRLRAIGTLGNIELIPLLGQNACRLMAPGSFTARVLERGASSSRCL